MKQLENLFSRQTETQESTLVMQDQQRYTLFIWMLPVFFIAPLALFSLQEWWQVMASGALKQEVLEGVFSLSQFNLALAWTAFVQGISWLAYAILAVLAFYRFRPTLMLLGYGVLVSSIFLQWQLPQVILALN